MVHYFSSCQGELPNQKFAVKAIDQDGQVVFDGIVATLQNGFFELWLPRFRRIDITVQRDGLAAGGMIDTVDGGLTCATTYRLQ